MDAPEPSRRRFGARCVRSDVAPRASCLVTERIRELHADALTGAGGTLMEVARGELHAALVRNVYAPEELSRVVERVEAGALDVYAQLRDHERDVPQISTLGIPISPSDLYPSGPEPGAYHNAAPRFAADAAQLFAPSLPFPERATEVLAALAGTPVELARDFAGRPYGELTLRHMPEGTGLPPHCENHYMGIAIYDAIRERTALDRKIGFFIPMRLPNEGGRFVVYDETFVAGVSPFAHTVLDIADGHGHAVVDAREGDMIVVGSGPRYHQVTRARGGDRWTVGGFGAFSRDGTRFVRWA